MITIKQDLKRDAFGRGHILVTVLSHHKQNSTQTTAKAELFLKLILISHALLQILDYVSVKDTPLQ